MQPLESLKAVIADFPGYDENLARDRSDELVRSYAGERLAEMQERLEPLDAALDDRISQLLLRTAFASQVSHKLYASSERSEVDAGPVAAADAQTIALADRAASIVAGGVGAYLDEITAVLDRRDAAMRGQPV